MFIAAATSVIGLTAFTTAPAAAQAQARSPHAAASPAAVMICHPSAGTVLSAKATSAKTAWLPTSISSSFLAGPGTISRSTTKTSSVGATISASFELDESAIFVSAKETYGISLSGSLSWSSTWQYTKSVPKGVTAKVQQYHQGSEVGIRERIEQVTNGKCGAVTHTVKYGNYFPLSSKDEDTYCYALTIHKTAGVQVRSRCVDKT